MTPAIGLVLVLLGAALALPGGRAKERLQSFSGPLAGVLALWMVGTLDVGETLQARFWGLDLHLVLVTKLKLVFAWAFAIALALWGVYAWKLKDLTERGFGLMYAGCAFGVLFAGDLLTLFLFWEGMAVASTVVILCGRTAASARAGFRYVMVHVLGGVLLLCGIVLRHASIGTLAFGPVGMEAPGSWLILAGFLVNAAAWPLAAWLPDAYPESSPTGNVLLGTFTTKTAVYVLAVGFAGVNVLMLIGGVMAIYAVVYALGTRNYRRVLAYSLVGQVGYMVCSIGAGGAYGASGAAAHAFMHVLYKSLLFMAAGAVFLQTGSAVGRKARGLWRKMPWTFGFAVVGAASISALPLTNAFVSKSVIFAALAETHGSWGHFAETALLIASALAPLYVGLRFLWLAFTAPGEADVEAEPAPLSMRLGMGGAAFLCLLFGVWPSLLFDLLPASMSGVHVFTWVHVGEQMLLVAIGTAAFLGIRALRRKVPFPHPDPLPDTDVVYLGATRGFVRFVEGPLMALFGRISAFFHETIPAHLGYFARNPAGWMRLAFERVRLAGAGLFGSAQSIDAAQVRFLRQVALYRETAGAAPWPIGRTVFFGALLLTVWVLMLVLS